MIYSPFMTNSDVDSELLAELSGKINQLISKGPLVEQSDKAYVDVTAAFEDRRYKRKEISAIGTLCTTAGWMRVDWTGSRLTPERGGNTFYKVRSYHLVAFDNLNDVKVTNPVSQG